MARSGLSCVNVNENGHPSHIMLSTTKTDGFKNAKVDAITDSNAAFEWEVISSELKGNKNQRLLIHFKCKKGETKEDRDPPPDPGNLTVTVSGCPDPGTTPVPVAYVNQK